jgi:hypothetical protein
MWLVSVAADAAGKHSLTHGPAWVKRLTPSIVFRGGWYETHAEQSGWVRDEHATSHQGG